VRLLRNAVQFRDTELLTEAAVILEHWPPFDRIDGVEVERSKRFLQARVCPL
jgi:hypothetical protein